MIQWKMFSTIVCQKQCEALYFVVSVSQFCHLKNHNTLFDIKLNHVFYIHCKIVIMIAVSKFYFK